MKGRIIAIDPGWSGAMAVFNNGKLETTHKCMPTSSETWELVRDDVIKSQLAILEWVHSMPGQGVASTFKFGYNYGMWNGMLASVSRETMLVPPTMWQKNWDNVPKDKKDRKNFLKQKAIEISGGKVKVTLQNADAICIGQWYIDKGIGEEQWYPKRNL
mgnify:FL=1